MVTVTASSAISGCLGVILADWTLAPVVAVMVVAPPLNVAFGVVIVKVALNPSA
jgi:hypothetical protein